MEKILIAIIAGIIIFYAIKYLVWPAIKIVVKYIVCLLKWVLITLPIWAVWLFFDNIKDISIFWGIVGISIVDFIKKLNNKDSHYYSGEHFVLNTKSKIAHKPWDSSAGTIGHNHREDVYTTKEELFDRGYRMKQDK